jgi:VWFA-related protein
VFREGVDVVHVSVTVTDQNGRPVNDLTKEEFAIFEDGKRQPIVSFRSMKDPSWEPIGLGLVLDVSASMAGLQITFEGMGPGGISRERYTDKFSTMKTAVERLITERLREPDEAHILTFSTEIRSLYPRPPPGHSPPPATLDKESLLDALRRMDRGVIGGQTAVYDAIAAALPTSSRGRLKKKVMLVVTDGNDNKSKIPRARVAEAARASGVTVYALIVGGELKRLEDERPVSVVARELSEITDPTGGLTRDVYGFWQLEDAIMAIGADFTQQYEIGFVSDHADGKYHKIVVGVRRPNVTMRHRRGYLAN